MALSKGGVVTGCSDKFIRIYQKGMKSVKWKAHEDQIMTFDEVPFINAFASGSKDNKIKVWSYQGDLMQELVGHTGPVISLCALEKGEIVSASFDCTVRIWQDGAEK